MGPFLTKIKFSQLGRLLRAVFGSHWKASPIGGKLLEVCPGAERSVLHGSESQQVKERRDVAEKYRGQEQDAAQTEHPAEADLAV